MNFEYDFAISFAGEKREIAKKLVNSLEKEKARVFYDKSLKFYYPNRPNKNHDVLDDFLEYFLRRCKDFNIIIKP